MTTFFRSDFNTLYCINCIIILIAIYSYFKQNFFYRYEKHLFCKKPFLGKPVLLNAGDWWLEFYAVLFLSICNHSIMVVSPRDLCIWNGNNSFLTWFFHASCICRRQQVDCVTWKHFSRHRTFILFPCLPASVSFRTACRQTWMLP